MIDAAHFDVRVSLRHAQTLYALAINKNRLGDRGRLAHQSQDVDAVALIEALAPRHLHGPIHLAWNPVEEPLNARGCRVSFGAPGHGGVGRLWRVGRELHGCTSTRLHAGQLLYRLLLQHLSGRYLFKSYSDVTLRLAAE